MPDAPPPLSPIAADADGWTLIHVHTRTDALRDGTLIDATDLARDAGFRVPVALSAAAWADAVSLTDAARGAGCDELGRLWDVLFCLRCAIASAGNADRSDVRFVVLVVRDRPEPERVALRALIGPGDAGEPVITIMLPGED